MMRGLIVAILLCLPSFAGWAQDIDAEIASLEEANDSGVHPMSTTQDIAANVFTGTVVKLRKDGSRLFDVVRIRNGDNVWVFRFMHITHNDFQLYKLLGLDPNVRETMEGDTLEVNLDCDFALHDNTKYLKTTRKGRTVRIFYPADDPRLCNIVRVINHTSAP